jgi:sulfhydrogenase subunit alpha
MHLGETLESNSLHVFVLALPDFLGYPSAIAMMDKYGDEVAGALALKKFANHVMEVTSGRMIHGENPTIGGFGKFPEEEVLLDIKKTAEEQLAFAEAGVGIVAGLEVPSFFESDTTFMCCEPGDGKYGLVGDSIRISNGEVVPVDEYRKLTNEKFCSHSAAKHCLYKNQPYTVGAIARMNNLGDRMKGRAGKLFKKHWNERWLRNPVFNNLAQAIEIVWALEQIPKVVDGLLKIKKDPELVQPTRQDGEGVGAVEAPRGTLYHGYKIKDGLVADANLIIPTGQSLEDIERFLKIAVEDMLKRGEDDETIRQTSEILVRSYDPCISCSTHLVEVERV